jgi:hypothetical protein
LDAVVKFGSEEPIASEGGWQLELVYKASHRDDSSGNDAKDESYSKDFEGKPSEVGLAS